MGQGQNKGGDGLNFLRRVCSRLKEKLVNWLLAGVTLHRLKVIDLHVGKQSMKITPNSLVFHHNNSDPSVQEGQMWYRSDTNDLKMYDGNSKFYVLKGIGIREIRAGPLSHRPSPGVAYRLYIATDSGSEIMYLDTGSGWVPLGAVFK